MWKFAKQISRTYSHLLGGEKMNFNDARYCHIITVIMTIV